MDNHHEKDCQGVSAYIQWTGRDGPQHIVVLVSIVQAIWQETGDSPTVAEPLSTRAGDSLRYPGNPRYLRRRRENSWRSAPKMPKRPKKEPAVEIEGAHVGMAVGGDGSPKGSALVVAVLLLRGFLRGPSGISLAFRALDRLCCDVGHRDSNCGEISRYCAAPAQLGEVSGKKQRATLLA